MLHVFMISFLAFMSYPCIIHVSIMSFTYNFLKTIFVIDMHLYNIYVFKCIMIWYQINLSTSHMIWHLRLRKFQRYKQNRRDDGRNTSFVNDFNWGTLNIVEMKVRWLT